MLTLHHLETSRSHRILWLLEEMGLPYELKRYQRNPQTRLAPPELKAIHPLGKSPVLTDEGLVLAESAVILEYIASRFGAQVPADLTQLWPASDSALHWPCRYWLHYAEGSLMNWLLMKLVFMSIPKQPAPFFVRPIARTLAARVQERLIEPNLKTALSYIEAHLSQNTWFAGEALTVADFQMSYPVDALLTLAGRSGDYPALQACKARMEARPAYQRALQKGGPVMPRA